MTKTTMTAMAVMLAGFGASLTAQDPQEMARRREIELTQAMARTAVEARITPGAPYSAEAVTESTQQLADGNRIVKKTVTRIFRDSEGRTRREQLAANGVDVQTVNISDPIAQSTFVLIPADHTAFRNAVFIATPRGVATATVAPGGSGVVTAATSADGSVRVEARENSEGERKAAVEAAAAGARSGGAGGSQAVAVGSARGRGGFDGATLPARVPGDPGVREDLGQQTIEGVMATGTRVITTIAAGAIGNEQPIKIVSEQWFSPELKVLVVTKHSDPRTGETSYRLTNIVRSEQARSLFEVPPDYTLKDSVIRRDMR